MKNRNRDKTDHPYLLIFVIIFITFFSIESATCGDIKCDYCGANIVSGKYIQVGQRYYHPDHFKCNFCNQPIGKEQFVTNDGKTYHQKCFRDNILPHCAICFKPIETQYTKLDGKQYHTDCSTKNLAPKCGICGEPLIGTYVTSGGKKYYNQCYERKAALRCSLCNGIIKGSYLVDYWGNHYHKYHEGRVPKCAFCGRFLSDRLAGGGFVFSDKYKICTRCEETSMSSRTLSKRLLVEVAGRLANFGIHVNPDNIPLKLVSEYNLSELGGGERGDNFGLTRYRFKKTAGIVVSRDFTIYILDELPRMHFIATAAHELMHVWIYLNTPEQINDQLTEGSCNYAAKLVLDQYRNKKADYLIENLLQNKDQTYGGGFRRVEKLVEDNGVDFWLNQLRHNPNFPAGY